MLLSRGAALLCAISLALVSGFASAEWELDNGRSTVNFLSVKNSSVAELHHFKSLAGGIGDDGTAQVTIDLDSVETLVPIRNQRMRELLFETVRFPAANLSAEVPASLLALAAGESATEKVDLTLELHGQSKVFSAAMVVNHIADGTLQVSLREPLVVKASDFGLAEGVNVLREVAGLEAISTAVPVSAHLVFTPAGGDSGKTDEE
jgi:polyisoprenoid-binding protein YceI